MGPPNRKPAKLFFIFAGICVIAIPLIVFSALSINSQEVMETASPTQSLDFDHNGQVVFDTYDDTTAVYMDGYSTSRTLDYYYSLRQYPGSPPFINHGLVDEKGEDYECLSCHARGGFTQSMNANAPVTPHPQHEYCQQCHVRPETDQLFVESSWVSVQPPRLGRSALPGSPPPIAHGIQMRENCIACHVGPGAVVTIRVEHPMRGNCRQCHLPATVEGLFQRQSQNDK
jgi:cytochrome c-type protein NapB